MGKKSLVFGLVSLLICVGPAIASPWDVSLPVLEDVYISGAEPDTNFNDHADMGPGRFMWVSPSPKLERGLFKFDLDLFAGLSGDDIVSASLWIETAGCAEPATFGIHRGLYDWSETTATYNTYGDQSAYGASTYVDSLTVTTGHTWYDLDVTDLVKAWVNGDYVNYGFYMTDIAGSAQLKAKEGSSIGPVLDVTYVPEPATMSLLAIGGLALLKRRIR